MDGAVCVPGDGLQLVKQRGVHHGHLVDDEVAAQGPVGQHAGPLGQLDALLQGGGAGADPWNTHTHSTSHTEDTHTHTARLTEHTHSLTHTLNSSGIKTTTRDIVGWNIIIHTVTQSKPILD